MAEHGNKMALNFARGPLRGVFSSTSRALFAGKEHTPPVHPDMSVTQFAPQEMHTKAKFKKAHRNEMFFFEVVLD